MSEKSTPLKSKQTVGNLFLFVLICSSSVVPAVMFLVKWFNSDLDTAVEHFCSFVDGCFHD